MTTQYTVWWLHNHTKQRSRDTFWSMCLTCQDKRQLFAMVNMSKFTDTVNSNRNILLCRRGRESPDSLQKSCSFFDVLYETLSKTNSLLFVVSCDFSIKCNTSIYPLLYLFFAFLLHVTPCFLASTVSLLLGRCTSSFQPKSCCQKVHCIVRTTTTMYIQWGFQKRFHKLRMPHGGC